MLRLSLFLICTWITVLGFSQGTVFDRFINDDHLMHASVSVCMIDASDGKMILEYNPEKSLTPASVLKLVTSAAALELLGPEYSFQTSVGYTGTLNKSTGHLSGDIIIKGGGDPSLGSAYFHDHYGDFLSEWVKEIKSAGIKSIEGRVIVDDSFYDYHPVPSKWLWEDAGNYYGAGAYGLSVFDNTYEIHFKYITSISTPTITKIVPDIHTFEFSNWLTAEGTTDLGYVFAAPYSTSGWLAGTIPANSSDFILKASITDPPLLVSKIIDKRLRDEGILITGKPTSVRLEKKPFTGTFYQISKTDSPPLKYIIEVLNHFSINLYAEHLIKELGRVFKNSPTTASGIEVIEEYLTDIRIDIGGIFIEDGSGLSPLNAINTKELAKMLFYLKTSGKHFNEYLYSLPEAGKKGPLNFFRDPVFESRLRIKTGSMTRVRSYAGYFTTSSGRNIAFAIIVNNYTGPSYHIVSGIENIIRQIIFEK